jgi:hypothetical protein
LAALVIAPHAVRCQASTDACGFTPGAQYPVNASCTNLAFNKPAGYGNDMTPTGCGGATYDDAFGWFAGTGNPVTVQYTPPSGADATLHVFSGTCASPVQIACSDNCCGGAVESVTISTALGTNYIVRVQRWGSNSAMNGQLCNFNAPTAPANDDPCGAINLPVNTSCVNTSATTVSATASTGVPAPGCANYAGGDVWFTVTVPAGGTVTVSTTAGGVTDGGMALYTATSCSGPFTLLSCNDDYNGLMPQITATGLTPGSTLYVRFWEYGNDNPGTFSICATIPPPPPANDDPCGALSVPVNSGTACVTQTPGTLVGATASSLPVAPCFGTPDNDVWFSFVATSTIHYINLNNVAGSTTDLYHAVYSGTCGSLTNISCSDPNNSVLTGLVPGNTYWVRVYSYASGAATTTFDVCVGTPPPPPGCGDVFYDSGGSSGNYANNELTITTICPDTPGDLVSLNFTSFNTESVDQLYIYDGNSTAAPLIGTYSGTTLPPYILATSASGCLTVVFDSDFSIVYSGWAANVGCLTPPAGDCVYMLQLHDSGGDGWGASHVRVRINGGAWTNYTVTGSDNLVLIGVNLGDLLEIEYVGGGPNQGQNTWSISKLGQIPYFTSTTPPATGTIWSQTVNCGPPPAQPQDCIGGITVCNNQAITNNSNNTGDVMDLNSSNQGCLASGERQGTWYFFSPETAGTIAFTIDPAGNDDYDFAVWGPYTQAQCPTGPPLRCSYDAPGPYNTGLNSTATATSEGAAGTGWVQDIDVLAGQVYVLYIDNFSTSGQAFTLSWQLSGGSSLDCTTLPVELLELAAEAHDPVIHVTWATATETHSDHFIVERSPDNKIFKPIGTVPAAGNSQFRHDYLFVDEHPYRGLNYYRLEQVDADGATMRSNTVVAYLSHGLAVALYPNPASDVLNVSFASPLAQDARLDVLDALGRSVGATFAATKGQGSASIPLMALARGCYQLRITLADGSTLPGGSFVKQ